MLIFIEKRLSLSLFHIYILVNTTWILKDTICDLYIELPVIYFLYHFIYLFIRVTGFYIYYLLFSNFWRKSLENLIDWLFNVNKTWWFVLCKSISSYGKWWCITIVSYQVFHFDLFFFCIWLEVLFEFAVGLMSLLASFYINFLSLSL